jgi:hypothetical protein
MQFISDFRYEITMAVGIGFCLLLYIVVRTIFGPDKKKAKAAKKNGGKAGAAGGSSLDDEEDAYKDHNLYGEEGDAEGVYKDWD